MRQLIAGLLTAALGVMPAAASSQRWPITETKLDNGLTVVVSEDHRAPVVVSQIWYEVGSSYEHRGITGISHLLEHMMFKGTEKHGPGEFSRIISRHGGEVNAFTSRDYTAYFERLAADRLALALRLEADRMQNLLLPPDEFKTERQVVIEERRQRVADDPGSLMHERFNAIAYLGSPYAQPIIGWRPDLEAMTVADLERWYKRYYAPNNATLVVAGDVEPKQVFELARQHFGAIEREPIPPAPGPTGMGVPGKRRVKYTDERAQVAELVMGYGVPSLATAEDRGASYALMMLAAVLDGGDGARLNQALVREQEVAASVSASYGAVARLDSQFSLHATPAPGTSIETLKAALREQVARLKAEPVSQATLERARQQLLADHLFGLDSVFNQAMEIGRLEATGIGWQALQGYESGLEGVSAKDIQRVAKQYLTQQRLTVGVLNPGASANKESAK